MIDCQGHSKSRRNRDDGSVVSYLLHKAWGPAWVEIPSTHIKLDTLAHACNPSVLLKWDRRWRQENSQKPGASLPCLAAEKKRPRCRGERRGPIPKNVLSLPCAGTPGTPVLTPEHTINTTEMRSCQSSCLTSDNWSGWTERCQSVQWAIFRPALGSNAE